MLTTFQADTPQLSEMQFVAFANAGIKKMLQIKTRDIDLVFDEVSEEMAKLLGLTAVTV